MAIEHQLAALLSRFELALAEQDWPQLAQLDTKLQQALPKIRARAKEPAIQAELQRLNAFYTTMIRAGEAEKSQTQQQITQQANHREGMLAYMQNR